MPEIVSCHADAVPHGFTMLDAIGGAVLPVWHTGAPTQVLGGALGMAHYALHTACSLRAAVQGSPKTAEPAPLSPSRHGVLKQRDILVCA